MRKKVKLLIFTLFTVFSVSSIWGVKSNAEEAAGEAASAVVSGMKDENTQRLEQTTGMDENGNIYPVDDTGGVFDSSVTSSKARSISPKVVNFKTKSNAVTEYKEFGTGIAGYTNGAYGADAAYLGTSDGKVKFMLSGVVGLVNASEVQIVDFQQAQAVSSYQVTNGRLLHNIATDMTTPGHAANLDNGEAPSYLSGGVTYYSYDGHYFYTDYGTMISDYDNNVRSNSVNANSPHYNYYQYLPLRSKTGYSDGDLTAMINGRVNATSKLLNTGSQFVSSQNIYGVNALLTAGIAANESAWGTSSISQSKNNIFGLNAVDSSPGTSADTYASVDECIRQFADSWMSKGYLYPGDWRYKGGFLGNKGSGINVSYASDPYWGEKAANIAWSLDKGGGNGDAGKYTIGIKDTINTNHSVVNVRNSGNAASVMLYNTGTHSNYAVLILDNQVSNSFYRIQSDSVLNADRTAVNTASGDYSFDNMYAYISSDYVTVVNQGISTPVSKELQAIAISTPPNKTAYVEGETFDASGMGVQAQWSDGSTTDVTAGITYQADALTKDTTQITVQYTADGITKTAAQNITVGAKATITEVALYPAQKELKPGEALVFGVFVAGTGNPVESVNWSVTGAASAKTKISSSGELQVGADETTETLTVKAVSTLDGAKSGIAVVTIVKESVEPPNPEQPSPEPPKPEQPNPEQPSPEQPSPEPPKPEQPNPEQPSVNVKDEATGIWVNGSLPEDAKLIVTQITKEAANYSELIKPVATNTILGVYDIDLKANLAEGQKVQLGFTVDENYNGQEVVILHYSEIDGRTFTETFKAVVKNGQVLIEVNGFSPYVIALDNAGENTGGGESGEVTPPTGDIPPTGDQGKQPESGAKPEDPVTPPAAPVQPKLELKPVSYTKAPLTGDDNRVVLWGILLLSSVVCMSAIVSRIKKEY